MHHQVNYKHINELQFYDFNWVIKRYFMLTINGLLRFKVFIGWVLWCWCGAWVDFNLEYRALCRRIFQFESKFSLGEWLGNRPNHEIYPPPVRTWVRFLPEVDPSKLCFGVTPTIPPWLCPWQILHKSQSKNLASAEAVH